MIWCWTVCTGFNCHPAGNSLTAQSTKVPKPKLKGKQLNLTSGNWGRLGDKGKGLGGKRWGGKEHMDTDIVIAEGTLRARGGFREDKL